MKPKILLIDDDQSLRDMYELKFRIDGSCDFTTAADPAQGLRLAEEILPDLILLDLVLPKSEQSLATLNEEIGFQLLASLKSNPVTNTIPVIVFTNLDDKTEHYAGRARSLGAYDYWIKAHCLPADTVQKVKSVIQQLGKP